MNDPESYCPFCKKTHDAPEFIEILERLQARVESLEAMLEGDDAGCEFEDTSAF